MSAFLEKKVFGIIRVGGGRERGQLRGEVGLQNESFETSWVKILARIF